MARSLSEVKGILEDALGTTLVNDKYFLLRQDDEEIQYWQGSYETNPDGRYIVGHSGRNLNELNQFISCIEQGKKGFLFYLFEKYKDYIFSFEIIDYNLGQCEILKESIFDDKLMNQNDIVRIPRGDLKKGNRVDIVAIRIGSQGNRDYSALKHYIISSDNRTYNRVIRNMIQYITVNGTKAIAANQTVQPHNLLVSGAPGTGKSHYLEEEVLRAGGVERNQAGDIIVDNGIIKDMIDKDTTSFSPENRQETAIKQYFDECVIRVTFYEDYSYENFVGCYKPIPDECEAKIEYAGQNGKITEDKITYRFVAGPFIETYIKAKKHPEYNYFLLVEEINRAKAASVFGDMFQLLDRKGGISEYNIKPDAALDEYLRAKLENYDGSIKLPPNMYIWATMNSADQGVLPLDSAFKRRWAQLYMDINPDTGKARSNILKMPKDGSMKLVLWENLRVEINRIILENGFDEDRCIGSWYFKDEEINQINGYFAESDSEKRRAMTNPLIDKLLYYLRQDVFRRNPEKMFKPEEEKRSGITMSDLRRRVRANEAIDNILNISLDWGDEKSIPADTVENK